ncbi:MAG TPA: BtrH N-terminal domain-containing protein [Candidatus Thermoplasmatota archaeon]|nr:BtrH N-terminal domain-containing protein [Candidatus Thermoplasmatota archaeon]
MNEITPFANCPALDGYHCQTSSLAKIYHFYRCPLSEDMILGLGAGMGFIYWQMKGNPKLKIPDYVFIGGRGNTKNFFEDVGKRTGVQITECSTSSGKKAEEALLKKLGKNEPMMMFGDMGFLPWFHFPTEYHFGGHTFVICGYNNTDTVLASDMDQTAAGLKKGFYAQITLEQLRKARGSPFKPFPPKNAYLEFDFKNFHPPTKNDISSSILQAVDSMLHPPIQNIGVPGIRKTAKMIQKWPSMFSDRELRMNLFTLYIFIEIGGTGGGCFRFMYSRFLREAADIIKNTALDLSSKIFQKSGTLFSEIGILFKDAETAKDVETKIQNACDLFERIADTEEEAFTDLISVLA